MKCSVCETNLIDSGIIIVDAHPMEGTYLTTKWCCPNHPEIFWNTNGDLYTERGCWELFRKLQFKNDMTGAIGSFARKMDVEIYKHDENKWIKLPFHWTLKIYAKYTGDEDGNVLSRKWKLQWIYKSYHFYSGTWRFISGFGKMIYHTIRHYLLGILPSEYMIKHIYGLNICKSHNKRGLRWYRAVGTWLVNKMGIDLT